MYSTGSVVNEHRALMRDGRVLAVFTDVVPCAVAVRELNDVERMREEIASLKDHVQRLEKELTDGRSE